MPPVAAFRRRAAETALVASLKGKTLGQSRVLPYLALAMADANCKMS
jgi:hypothetical protein